MGRASRRKHERTAVPAWAGWLTVAAYQRFRADFAAALTAAGFRIRRFVAGEGAFWVEPTEAPATPGEELELRVSVVNLVGAMQTSPVESWPRLIELYVARAREAVDERALKPFEQVADRLRVRVWPRFPIDSRLLVGRELAPGLVLSPVIDSPSSVRVVSAPELDAWGRPLEELLELGLRRLVECEPLPEPAMVAVADGVQVARYASASSYVAAHVARLGDLVEHHERGALVSIPRRDLLMLHPIWSAAEAMLAMEWMAANVPDLHGAAPYGISRFVYWWRSGSLAQVTFEHKPGEILLAPPIELRAIFTEALGTGRGSA